MHPSLRPDRSSRTRRALALATAGLLTTSALALTSTGADAALSTVGPNDPARGNFPSFYTDGPGGLSLQLCLDGPPLCLTTADELLASGAEGEGFYYSASASVGGFDVALVLEAAYLEVGQPIVFQRLQFASRNDALEPGARYTITHPYGEQTCVADATGNIVNNACRSQTGGVAANDFDGALTGPIGPFLTWDTFGGVGGPPAGYIGDGVTPHRVVGSPLGPTRNFVSVQGPRIVADGSCGVQCARTDLLVVSGKLAPGAMGSTSPRGIAFGSRVGPVTSRVTYTSVGTQAITVANVTAVAPFAISGNTCNGASLAPGAQCGFDVTYTPTPGVTSTGTVAVVDGTGTKTIALSGKGAQAAVALSTARAVLPDTEVGKDSSTLVTVTNNGDLPFTLGRATLGGPHAADYRFGLVPNECLPGATLGVGARCDLRVLFTPRSTGVRSATLNVPAEGGTLRSIPVVGEGLADRTAPALTLRKPSPGAKRVRPTADVVAGFSEAVTGVTKRSVRLVDTRSGSRVEGKVTKLAGNRWKLDPTRTLRRGTVYRVRLVGAGTGIRDLSGNRLGNTGWRFRTR